MTAFVAWVGVDDRAPASIYLAADSRFSWPPDQSGTIATWDFGRKVFVSKNCPDLLGYVGDVLFPSIVLGQIVEAIDHRVMFTSRDSPESRFDEICGAVRLSFGTFPLDQARRGFSVAYATRDAGGRWPLFSLWVLHWSPTNGWSRESVAMPQKSSAIRLLGTGSAAVTTWQQRWDSTTEGRTSRSVYSAFCDAIRSQSDPYSGVATQLVGLHRIGNGLSFGTIAPSAPSLFGLPLSETAAAFGDLQWYNPLFERCTSNGQRLEGAQKHRSPKGLGRALKSNDH